MSKKTEKKTEAPRMERTIAEWLQINSTWTYLCGNNPQGMIKEFPIEVTFAIDRLIAQLKPAFDSMSKSRKPIAEKHGADDNDRCPTPEAQAAFDEELKPVKDSLFAVDFPRLSKRILLASGMSLRGGVFTGAFGDLFTE